jgi:cysteinyl-tRNA synthetase
MPLRIYNTLSRQEEDFSPSEPGHVRIYVCGPTVYDLSHLGHARAYINFDTIVRYLRRDQRVTYIRNFTDVDDKIIKRAQATGETPILLAARFIDEFQQDMAALGCAPPDIAPKVTEHIGEIVSLIGELVEKDMAYEANGDVYYAVERFADYGRLGRRTLEDMEAGARVEVLKHKRHPMDFALWKAAKLDEICWDSPWGKGRPGWHIECSAMAKKYFGSTFDLHGGGRDLIFPHHENEIAQSEAASGEPLARLWMHNGLVNIDNAKMSKSLGNFFTIRQILEKFDPQILRFYLLSTHYRSAINFSDAALREAEGRLVYIYTTLQRLVTALGHDKGEAEPSTGELTHPLVAGMQDRFVAAMSADFNTPLVLGDLSPIFKIINELVGLPPSEDAAMAARRLHTLRCIASGMRQVGASLGLFLEEPATVLGRIEARRMQQRALDPEAIERLLEARTAARKAKDFARADAIRKELEQLGVRIKDVDGKTTWAAI